jgi:hypothetical protein
MHQRSPRRLSLRLVAAILLVCAATTCLSANTARAGDLSGCWQGCWDNWHDAFSGRVKAKIWKCDETHYCGEFSGIALLVIPYRYRSTLTVTHVEGDKTYFTSYKHLPIWGGYTMCGYVSGCKFVARYDKCDGSGGGCWWMNRTCSCSCGCCCR